jgi:hypothetical protein
MTRLTATVAWVVALGALAGGCDTVPKALYDQAIGERDEARKQLADCQNEASGLKQQIGQLTGRLRAAEDRATGAEARLTAAQKDLDQARAALSALTGQGGSLEARLAAALKERDDARREAQAAAAKVTELQQAMAAAQAELLAMKKDGALRDALQTLRNVTLASAEEMVLKGGPAKSTFARDTFAQWLPTLGFRVVEAGPLAIQVTGSAKLVDKFGDFFAFECALKGDVTNANTRNQVASLSVTERGERELDETKAAESAVRAAARKLAAGLGDEIARNAEAMSVVKMKLVIAGSASAGLGADLAKKPGVFYCWPEPGAGEYEILCRLDCQKILSGHLDELKVKATVLERKGDPIKWDPKARW